MNIKNFIEKYYKHFNAATLVDAAKEYENQINKGSKMLVSMAGAMSTAEIGKIFSEIIRQEKVHIVSCTGAAFSSLGRLKSSVVNYCVPSYGPPLLRAAHPLHKAR